MDVPIDFQMGFMDGLIADTIEKKSSPEYLRGYRSGQRVRVFKGVGVNFDFIGRDVRVEFTVDAS